MKCFLRILLYTAIILISAPVYAEKHIEVYIVQQELHTGIVFRITDVNPELLPQAKYFGGFNWLDVGWGDYEFYQAPNDDPILALRAIAIPTLSVLRVDAFRLHPDDYYGNYRKLRFCLTRKEFDNLCMAIAASFLKDEDGNTSVIQTGYGLKFYKATGKYHLMNTCNTWVARMFREAGLNNRISGIITAGQLFSSLRRYECVN